MAVDQGVLDDLADRVRRRRWTDLVEGADWSHGTSLEYLAELADHWVEGFDWRQQEGMLNDRLPGWAVDLGGRRVHCARSRGAGPAMEQPDALVADIREFVRPRGPIDLLRSR